MAQPPPLGYVAMWNSFEFNTKELVNVDNFTIIVNANNELEVGTVTASHIASVNATAIQDREDLVDDDTLNVAANKLQVKDGGVGFAQLKDFAVGTAKLGDFAVTEAKLGSQSVTAAKLATGAVTNVKLAGGAVSSSKLGSYSVTESKLADEAVATDKLADGAVTAPKLGPSSVGSAAIASGAVTALKLGPSSVGPAALASGAVTPAKLAAGTADGQILEYTVAGGWAVTALPSASGTFAADDNAGASNLPSIYFTTHPNTGLLYESDKFTLQWTGAGAPAPHVTKLELDANCHVEAKEGDFLLSDGPLLVRAAAGTVLDLRTTNGSFKDECTVMLNSERGALGYKPAASALYGSSDQLYFSSEKTMAFCNTLDNHLYIGINQAAGDQAAIRLLTGQDLRLGSPNTVACFDGVNYKMFIAPTPTSSTRLEIDSNEIVQRNNGLYVKNQSNQSYAGIYFRTADYANTNIIDEIEIKKASGTHINRRLTLEHPSSTDEHFINLNRTGSLPTARITFSNNGSHKAGLRMLASEDIELYTSDYGRRLLMYASGTPRFVNGLDVMGNFYTNRLRHSDAPFSNMIGYWGVTFLPPGGYARIFFGDPLTTDMNYHFSHFQPFSYTSGFSFGTNFPYLLYANNAFSIKVTVTISFSADSTVSFQQYNFGLCNGITTTGSGSTIFPAQAVIYGAFSTHTDKEMSTGTVTGWIPKSVLTASGGVLSFFISSSTAKGLDTTGTFFTWGKAIITISMEAYT